MTAQSIVLDWHCMGCGTDYRGHVESRRCAETPAARDDTPVRHRHAPAATGDAPEGPAAPSAGEGSRTPGEPRAAGPASPRGAQPPGRRVIICQLCRKRLHEQPSGDWYHNHNGSVFCHPGDGTGRSAIPLAIGGQS